MKIIKHKEQKPITELFGRKKPTPAPEKIGINREWDKHYETMESIRKSGVPIHLVGMYFSEGTAMQDELISKIFTSWLDNYDELSKLFHWDRK